ncbi:MAG TPA: FN3 associated domain-containing protein, partial [Sphingobacteriaceae bacterium]
VALKNQGYNTQIKYTLDGSEPTAASLNYSSPINVTLPITIRAASFKNGERISEVSRRTVVILPVEARQ